MKPGYPHGSACFPSMRKGNRITGSPPWQTLSEHVSMFASTRGGFKRTKSVSMGFGIFMFGLLMKSSEWCSTVQYSDFYRYYQE